MMAEEKKNKPNKEDKPIPFPAPEEPDIYEMDAAQLKEYLFSLEEQLAQLDAREPRSQRSETYEAWADEHEELEDYMDEIRDLLDELE